MTALDVIEARPEHAPAMLEVIHRSFAARPALDPPSTALDETRESVEQAIVEHGGLIVLRHGSAMGAMLFDKSRPGLLGFRRVAVVPAGQDRGVASAMVGVAEDIAEARGKDGVWLHVRTELPDTVRFWTHRKYLACERDGTLVTMQKTLWLATSASNAADMQALAARLATLLKAGDVLVLSGDLGAGKTTFTQGLADGLNVRGPITSPTFVIARTHPSLVGGPALVHVDAYRLSSAAELDDIDLDATTDQAVTVVEWGDNLAEHLAESWLHVRIESVATESGDLTDDPDPTQDHAPRLVTIRPHGPRWVGVPLRSTVLN